MFKKPKAGSGGGGLSGLLKTGGKIAIALEVACFGVLYCGYRYIRSFYNRVVYILTFRSYSPLLPTGKL